MTGPPTALRSLHTAPWNDVAWTSTSSPPAPATGFSWREARRRAVRQDRSADERAAVTETTRPSVARSRVLFGTRALAVLGGNGLESPHPQRRASHAQSAFSLRHARRRPRRRGAS